MAKNLEADKYKTFAEALTDFRQQTTAAVTAASSPTPAPSLDAPKK